MAIHITGVMVIRDEAATVRLTLSSVVGLIDSLVVIEHASTDHCGTIARMWAAQHNIPCLLAKGDVDDTLEKLRALALRIAWQSFKPDWTFTLDGDMYFVHTDMIRGLAEAGNYDSFKFRTLNFSMDIHHTAGMNPPHVWLFRNKGRGVASLANFSPSHAIYAEDPDVDRFIGWNLTYLKDLEHIFWRRHIPEMRARNRGLPIDEWVSVDHVIKDMYGVARPDRRTMAQFVLGIFQTPGADDEAKYGKREWELARPRPYGEGGWEAIPQVILDHPVSRYRALTAKAPNGDIIFVGRYPDMMEGT